MEIRKDYYPNDIAFALVGLSGAEIYDENGEQNPDVQDCENALYQLMAIAENKYNSDYYRKIWDVLENLTERYLNAEI